MPDTDSSMMRHQQDLDTAQKIDADETAASPDKTDSDPASAAARAAALAGGAAQPGSQDDVLAQNQRSDYTRENEVFEDGRTDARPAPGSRPPLASKGRSLLGD
jgi:hypothetical protein